MPPPANQLFDSDSESNDDAKDLTVKVNKKFAQEYQTRKETEELKRSVQFERVDDDNDSSSESSEDEDAELLTTKMDADIMKTINALRNKDASIYDKSTKFFDDDDDDDEHQKKSKSKPKRYKDVVREQVLEQIEQEENNKIGADSKTDDSRFVYNEEQEEIRKAFLKSTASDDDSNDGNNDSDDDGFMTVKKRHHFAEDGKTEEAKAELRTEIEKLESSLEGKKSSLVDPKGEVEDGERFLLNFFKNRSWVERNDDDDDQEGSDNDDGGDGHIENSKKDGKGYTSDDSLHELEEADNFESKYNFRFEEAASESATGADFSIIGYARGQTMTTLRRKDESRKEKRQQRKERKQAERKAKEEKLKRLKNAKRKELEGKLKQVQSVLGEVDGDAAAIDEAAIMKLLEGDYDPEKFETLMKDAYNDDYYEKEDAKWKSDTDVRQDLQKDEDGDMLVGQDDPDGGLYDTVEESHVDGEGDADDAENDEDEWIEEEEPYHDPEETELEKKVKTKIEDELYKLDYEDIVAGMPTRFKYRQVEANNFGLSTEEILLARDTSLKQFVSLKKIAPYNEGEEYFVGSKRRRKFREDLKKDLAEEQSAVKSDKLDETTGDNDNEKEEGKSKKKRRRLKKSRKKEGKEGEKPVVEADGIEVTERRTSLTEKSQNTTQESEEAPTKTKRRRKKSKKSRSDAEPSPTDSKGASPEKVKSKRKHKKKSKIEGVSESRLASYGL